MADDNVLAEDVRRTITKADQFKAIRLALRKAMAKVRITQGQRDTILRRVHNDGTTDA